MIAKDNYLLKKAVILFIFSIILLIPIFIMSNIATNRWGLYFNNLSDIDNVWGSSQSISGPTIIIPSTIDKHITKSVIKDGKETTEGAWSVEHLLSIFTPTEYNVDVKIHEKLLEDKIDRQSGYLADITLTGYFDINMPDNITMQSINWNGTTITFGMESTKSISKIDEFKIGNQNITLEQGSNIRNFEGFQNGGRSDFKINGNIKKLPFSIKFTLKGREKFSILPIGDKNNISVNSTLKNPIFTGELPLSSEINNNGFTAQWEVQNSGLINTEQISSEANSREIIISFAENIPPYPKVQSAIKFAYLFVILTLLVLFIFDVVGKRSISLMQYIFIGIALIAFYLLLLALIEHLPFLIGYIISATAITVPIVIYTSTFMNDKRYGVGICAILAGLYLVLLSILELQDYALLTGTGLILIVLYALMYLTRHLRTTGNDKTMDSK